MPPAQSPPSAHLKHVSPARLFWGDVYIAWRILNRARHRIMAAVFGVPTEGEGSNLLWLIEVGAIARAVHRVAAAPRREVRKWESSPTAVGDTMIGAAALKETLDSIAGHPSRDTSSAAALIAFAVLAHLSRPAVEGSLRAVRESFRGVIAEALRLRVRFTARAASGRYDT
jgi:hypothetical protein